MERLVARPLSIMVVVMMVMMPEVPAERANDDVMMMVVVMVIENLRHLAFVGRGVGLLRQSGVIRF